MVEPDKESASTRSEVIDDLGEQTKELCKVHDHIGRVIGNLSFHHEFFTDQSSKSCKFTFESVIRCFLYKEIVQLSQSEVERKLANWTYLRLYFDLDEAPLQQWLSWAEKHRINHRDRTTLSTVADKMRGICRDHGVLRNDTPVPTIGEVKSAEGVETEQIREAIQIATDLGFSEFPDPRESNSKYPLEAFFERQAFLNMTDMGTTSKRRLFGWMSGREEVPHGSTHNRTLKQVASPDPQTTFSQFEQGSVTPEWERIRDTVLPAFHAGVEKQLDEIAGRDRQGIRTPVKAAIDITTIPYWSSPYRDEEKVGSDEEPETWETSTGTEREAYIKEDHPEMVSGFKSGSKEKTERGYKFATLTVVAEGTPFILAIEPVRDRRGWEKGDERVERERTPRAELVERLIEQAKQHVEIHKVFLDREFDVHRVRDVVDRGNIQYVIGKQNRSAADAYNIEEIKEDPVYDLRVEHAELTVDGRTHKVSIIYLPTDKDYSMFTVNGWVDNHRAKALTDQYRQRWVIENEYKSIKAHFLPQIATKDYRSRFLYFVIGVILHNVWRLANFIVRDEMDVDLGEDPPIPAVEIVLLLGRFLLDPGD